MSIALDKATLRFVRDELLPTFTPTETRLLIALMMAENEELFEHKLRYILFGEQQTQTIHLHIQNIRAKKSDFEIIYVDRRYKLVRR